MNFFSPAQLIGYVAFVLGVSSFLQKSDRRLIVFNASQCVAYAIHFFLLGNLTACGTSVVSAIRSATLLRIRTKALAVLFIGFFLLVGLFVAHRPLSWLPVIGCVISTYGMFFLFGVRMRLALLSSTVLWIVNNAASGSIGGLALECTIFLANSTTIIRMLLNGEWSKPQAVQVQPKTQPSAGK